MEARQTLGRLGEDIACDHLRTLGHRILARNWRSGHREVDIISRADDGLHFVEVKSMTVPNGTDPAEKVDRAKRRHITAAALDYLNATGGSQEVFFDILTVLFDGPSATVTYYPQAWIPMYT